MTDCPASFCMWISDGAWCNLIVGIASMALLFRNRDANPRLVDDVNFPVRVLDVMRAAIRHPQPRGAIHRGRRAVREVIRPIPLVDFRPLVFTNHTPERRLIIVAHVPAQTRPIPPATRTLASCPRHHVNILLGYTYVVAVPVKQSYHARLLVVVESQSRVPPRN